MPNRLTTLSPADVAALTRVFARLPLHGLALPPLESVDDVVRCLDAVAVAVQALVEVADRDARAAEEMDRDLEGARRLWRRIAS